MKNPFIHIVINMYFSDGRGMNVKNLSITWRLVGENAVSSAIGGVIGLLAASTFKVEILFSIGIILLIVATLTGILFIIWLLRNIRLRPYVGNRQDYAPDPKDFEYIRFSNVLQETDKLIIIVGSKKQTISNKLGEQWRVADTDLRVAKNLQKYLSNKYPMSCKIKADRIVQEGMEVISPDDKKRSNLVLVGGPDFNRVTQEISKKLPIVYRRDANDARYNHIYSLISKNRYYGSRCATIQAVPRPFDNDNNIAIVVFGMERRGTNAAVKALMEKPEKELKNSSKENYPAKVIIDIQWDQNDNVIGDTIFSPED
jgi:hypothetical protein